MDLDRLKGGGIRMKKSKQNPKVTKWLKQKVSGHESHALAAMRRIYNDKEQLTFEPSSKSSGRRWRSHCRWVKSLPKEDLGITLAHNCECLEQAMEIYRMCIKLMNHEQCDRLFARIMKKYGGFPIQFNDAKFYFERQSA
jgi:hypothetical protein